MSSGVIAVVAFVAGLGLAGVTAAGVAQSVQTSSTPDDEPGAVQVETVDYGSN
ncbi:MAG: hypothetical protein QM621_12725 [Aeromicrobium sp.]|uniref:hypothetical protein n=1 Tax=Aeromicrobium sp. TaxID=1871063 RepID=UPI0039E2DF7F